MYFYWGIHISFVSFCFHPNTHTALLSPVANPENPLVGGGGPNNLAEAHQSPLMEIWVSFFVSKFRGWAGPWAPLRSATGYCSNTRLVCNTNFLVYY